MSAVPPDNKTLSKKNLRLKALLVQKEKKCRVLQRQVKNLTCILEDLIQRTDISKPNPPDPTKPQTTPEFKIDLLTTTEVIKVKDIAEWEVGMFQLFACEEAIQPLRRQKRLHLFNVTSDHATDDGPTGLNHIKEICQQNDIKLTFEGMVSENR